MPYLTGLNKKCWNCDECWNGLYPYAVNKCAKPETIPDQTCINAKNKLKDIYNLIKNDQTIKTYLNEGFCPENRNTMHSIWCCPDNQATVYSEYVKMGNCS